MAFPIGVGRGLIQSSPSNPYRLGSPTVDRGLLARTVGARTNRVIDVPTQVVSYADPLAAAAAASANKRNAHERALVRLAGEVASMKRAGNAVALSIPGQQGMYAAPDQDGKGGVIPFPVLTIPQNAAAGDIIEVELESDSVARGLLTGTVLELISGLVGGGLAGDDISQSALEISMLINGMTMPTFFRVPLDSFIPTAYGQQPIPVNRFVGPDIQLVIQARVLDNLNMSADGLIRVRGWSGNGNTYNRRVTVGG